MSRRRLSLDKLLLRACIQSQEQSLKGKGSSARTHWRVLAQPHWTTARTTSAACYSNLVVVGLRSGQRNSAEECHQLGDLSHNLRLIEANAGTCYREPARIRQRASQRATSWRNRANGPSERSWPRKQRWTAPARVVNQARYATSSSNVRTTSTNCR